MAFFSTHNVQISGIAACVPKNRVSNFELDYLNAGEIKKLVDTIGIESRPIAGPGMCASDLCVSAANKLIEDLNWRREEIDALFFVSQTPDYSLPGTSFHIQERLGLPKSCACFDINQGCAGYVYGLSLMSSFMSATKLKKGLLLVGDTISKLISPANQSLTPLFADCGTATALSYDDNAAPMYFNISSEGQNFDAIIVEKGGARDTEANSTRQLTMKGLEVFNFSLKKVIPGIEELLSLSGKHKHDIDYFFFHQANKLILDSLGAKLSIDSHKIPSSLQHFGNTSGATIPLTIVNHFDTETIPDSKLLLSGFGVGLSIASSIVDFKHVTRSPLIEI